jgi:tetratricopeptide (TPR) repeat protein
MRSVVVAIAITVIASSSSVRAECITESAEAVKLANEGDALRQSNVDEAVSKYEQAFAAARTSSRIASKLAAAYEKKESWAKAIDALDKARNLDPTNASYAFRLGRARAYGAAKGVATYVEAQNAFADAVRLDPNWAEAHFELANVMWELDDETGALGELTKAVKLGPTHASHWAALADLYRRLNLMPEASKVVAEASRFLKGDDFDFGRVAGRVHDRAGEVDASVASYESAKRACGQCSGAQAVIFFELGRAYAQGKRSSESRANLLSFSRLICRGAVAGRYVDECGQAADLMR